MIDPPAGAIIRRPRWPWVVLGLGLVWTVLIRVPLVLNAEDHLDSDLAVDGLTLIDAVNGQWRWHYPGTPHMGIMPLLFSYPQALIWGPSAVTLASGGTLIWLLIVTGTFWLAWKTYGPSVAGWAILPLVFSSTGTIWLSGRITGGHLLTLAWHTLAFVGLHACLTGGGRLRAAALGLWCGLGLYLDLMFLFTLFGLAPAALLAWFFGGRWRLKVGTVSAFLIAMIAGFLPHEAGRLVDPYDAYPSQFTANFEGPAIRDHERLLVRRCLPRLISGAELKDDLPLGQLMYDAAGRGRSNEPSWQERMAVLFLAGFVAAAIRLGLDPLLTGDPGRKAIGLGTFLSVVLIVGAFLVNRNVFNSDNYRYLIYLLLPWSLGFGLLMSGLARLGPLGRTAVGVLVFILVGAMTASTLAWYHDRLRYLDKEWRVVEIGRSHWSVLPLWPRLHFDVVEQRTYVVPRDVTHVFGGYWDVYRMAFLSGKKVVGIPYPIYPNRFPGWSRGLGPERGKLLVIGLRGERIVGPLQWRAPEFSERDKALDPRSTFNWQVPFGTVWRNDGRDPAEIDRIGVIIPSAARAGQ